MPHKYACTWLHQLTKLSRVVVPVLLGLISSCSIQSGWAQTTQSGLTTELTSVLHPSPNAAALGKFTEVPVSLHTGLPEISIPIWAVQKGDIAVNVALSYYGGGVKVDEVASWVGMGWSLSGAGMITRSSRGKPDDIERFKSFEQPRINQYIDRTMSDQEKEQFILGIYNGDVDSESDLYSLSVGGISCQFFIDRTGEFVTMPRESNLKIRYNTPDAHGTRYPWIVTDGKGVEYKFLEAEGGTVQHYSISPGGTSNDGGYFSGETSWALNQIEDTKGNTVNFSYVGDGSSFSNITSEYVSVMTDYHPACVSRDTRGYSYALNQGTSLRLTSISCAKEEVRFIADPVARLDLAYAHRLQSIQILHAGKAQKSYRLFTSYLGTTAIGTRGVYYRETPNESRLWLDSLREEGGSGGRIIPPYRFTYNSALLPYRGSAAQDHWGFYNGVDNTSRVSYAVGLTRMGANKNPNPAYSIAGTLTRIRYPTGGTIDFVYEPNKYAAAASPASTLPLDSTFALATVYATGLHRDQEGYVKYEFIVDEPFEVTSAVVDATNTVDMIMVIDRTVDGQRPTEAHGFTWNVLVYPEGQNTSIPFRVSQGAAHARLPVGRYYLHVNVTRTDAEDRPDVVLSARLHADVTPFASNTAIERVGPGNRVRQIIKRFGNAPAEVRTYEYTDPTTGKSSGVLGNFPNYQSNKKIMVVSALEDNSIVVPCNCEDYSSYSNYPLINSKASYIGYGHVTEYFDSARGQGKKTYTYTTYADFNDLNYTPAYPYPPNSSQQWKRGLPLVEQTFASGASTSTAFQKQRTDSSAYTVLPTSLRRATGIKVGLPIRFDGNFMITESGKYALMSIAEYPLESDSYQLAVKTTTQYTPTGRLTTASLYTYTPDTYQIRRLKTRNSDGSWLAQRFHYPTDYRANASTSPLLAGLLAANRVTVPIEQTTIRWGGTTPKLISGVAHEYGVTTSATGLKRFFLQRLHTVATSGTDTTQHYDMLTVPSFYEEKAQIVKVNALSLPLLEKTKGNRMVSYKWGYDNSYVVAECRNALDTEFFYEGFEDDANASVGTARSGVKYTTGTYTLSWSKPTSKPYVLSYWYRQNGQWKYQQRPYAGPTFTLNEGDAYDDIRIHPADAQMTTYTFEPLVGMTSKTDPSNRMTSYEYDALGRLQRVRDEQGRVLSENEYRYARP